MIQKHHNSKTECPILCQYGFSAQIDNLSEIKVTVTFFSLFFLFFFPPRHSRVILTLNRTSTAEAENVTFGEEMDDLEIPSVPSDSLIAGCGVSYIP